MDLRLFWGVVKRYKRLAIGGTLLAMILAIFSYGTPGLSNGKPTIIARGSVTWASQAELLIGQDDGVYGRADAKTLATGSPGYMSSLTPVYTAIANSTAVQSVIRAAKIPGTVVATEGVDPLTGAYQPLVMLTAAAPTESDAAKLAAVGIKAFQTNVAQMEAAAGIPQNSRVVLQVIQTGLPPHIAAKPKLTIPVLILFALMTGLIVLLFSLENRDPQTAAKFGRVTSGMEAGAPAENGRFVAPPPAIHASSSGARDHKQDRLHEPNDHPAVLTKILKRG